MPLLGKGNVDILELVAKELGVDRKQILAQDLFVYNREAGTKLGPDGELILCPRLDDLQCVYGLLEGFLRQETPLETPVLCLFDNEEIAALPRRGPCLRCCPDVLRRICLEQGLGETDYLRLLAGSMMVSADNAHGVHPNHPEKAALTNRPKLGEGVVVKYGTGYATTGASAGLLLEMLRRKNVPVPELFQPFRRGGRQYPGCAVRDPGQRENRGHRSGTAGHALRQRDGGGCGYRLSGGRYGDILRCSHSGECRRQLSG